MTVMCSSLRAAAPVGQLNQRMTSLVVLHHLLQLLQGLQ